MSFTEDNYEKAVTALFEQMGYTHLYGPDIERDYYVPFYAYSGGYPFSISGDIRSVPS